MRKSLLIGLIVSVLALGGIGAAFATNMDVIGIGALSSGTGVVPQVNVDRVDWSVGGDAHSPYIDYLSIVFDQDLHALDPGTSSILQGDLMIDFQNQSGVSVGMFHCGPELGSCGDLLYDSGPGGPTNIHLDVTSANADPHDVYYIKITYAN